jgi:hypothetical protein
MGVFLRWGVFGILAVAGLLYAYNASKRMAENRQAARPPAVAPVAAADPATVDAGEPETPAEAPARKAGIPAHCEVELFVAMRATDARRDGDPLDRLLRIQEIAFVTDPALKERHVQVATRWYSLAGEPPPLQDLIDEVVRDCRKFNPAP